ncbi:MAG: RluA family pseudouridine synthase [Myxococcales bacterium]|nr:RluA family pseudouridine synthase [Myxococcales bacterium]
MIELRVEEDSAGVRLDKYLRTKLPAVPPSHLFKMIRTKKVRVNGKRAQPEQKLAKDDLVAIRGAEERLLTPPPRRKEPPPVDASKLKVLFEDEWMMAVDKPSGLAVHPGSGIRGGTLVDYVRAYLGPRAVRNDFAASPAHRLDRETSGTILVAKRRPAMVHFTDVFTRGLARKRYLTLVQGRVPKDKGVIDLALSEHQQTAESRALRGVNLQQASTRYGVLGRTSACSYLEAIPETGRTHQIRRHLAAVGHPVAGDRRYGDFAFNREAKARWGLRRLFLHAERIEFPHPADRQRMTIVSPLPEELSDVLRRAGIEQR